MQTTYHKKGLLALVAMAAVMILITPAQAFELKISGQVNQMIMAADNGFDDEIFIADNDNSSTRIRAIGEEEISWVTAGFKIEFEAQRNASNTLDIGNNSDGTFEWNDRWLEAYFKTKYGKLSIGKGSGAADTTSEVDLSGTTVINYSGVNDTAGGFTWRQKDGTPIRAGLTVGQTRNNFDGLGRNDRLRYDSPEFFGVTLAGSFTNGGAYEIGGFYAIDFEKFGKLAAGLGYVDAKNRESGGTRLDFKQWGGSVSWLHPIGANVTLALGQRDQRAAGQVKADNGYLKFGWRFLKIHAASIEYGRTKDLNQNGDESNNWGLGYVITPWQGVEFYGSLRSYDFSQSGGPNPENLSQAMVGTRIKF